MDTCRCGGLAQHVVLSMEEPQQKLMKIRNGFGEYKVTLS
jgi:hypothetical protein